MGMEKFYLEPGYIFISDKPSLIHTVLGSCVSVCFWDKKLEMGGMNHYIFPEAKDEKTAKYGDVAIKHLIYLMKEYGSSLEDIQAHIVGGAQNPEINSLIGPENIEVAHKILVEYGLQIATADVGGFVGRKVIFNNQNGELLVYKGVTIRRNDWYSE